MLLALSLLFFGDINCLHTIFAPLESLFVVSSNRERVIDVLMRWLGVLLYEAQAVKTDDKARQQINK
jgi:hypothetical protein